MSAAEDAVRADVWLWRARFLKSRSQATALCETGKVRLWRGGAETRLDKPSRTVKPGDRLVFALGGKLVDVEVVSLGTRRGPAEEARGLYRDGARLE